MREFLRRPPVFLALLFLASLFVFINSARRAENLGPVPQAVVLLFSYPEVAVTAATSGIASLWTDYVALVGLRQDYNELLAENARLRAERSRLFDLAAENARLKKLLDFKEQRPGTLLPARVIAAAQGGAAATLTIDRGSADGLRSDLAVVSYDGLIGRTALVTPMTALVVLIEDPRSRVPVRTLRTRARGIVAGRGPGEDLLLERVRRTEDIEPGDELFTSGTGMVFPKGIRVGTVREVEKQTFGVLQNVELDPAVDFSRIEEVLVLLEATRDAAEVGEEYSGRGTTTAEAGL